LDDIKQLEDLQARTVKDMEVKFAAQLKQANDDLNARDQRYVRELQEKE